MPLVEPIDEGAHPAGAEPLWSESWYFDAIADDGSIGAYHRIARLENRGVWVAGTCIARPGEPTVMAAAELPLGGGTDAAGSLLEAPGVSAEHRCERPLERSSVRVEAEGRAFADHAAPLREEGGEPVAVALELSWETDGVPYRWGHSTRYEIPCRVSGTVRLGDEELTLTGPGQRDHSWGARDWWASDWVWSALHLDDGTHTHAVSVPQHPNFAVGYVQRDGELTPIVRIEDSHEVAEDGLIEAGRIAMHPGGPDVTLEPIAHGPVLLRSEDGRVSEFPRAICRLETTDGRAGWGWVEWNRNRTAPDAG